MASSIAYSTLLGLAQPVNGQEAGTWGDDINLGLTNYLDSAIAGTLTISSSSDATLSISNYSTANPNLGSSSSQYMILSCTANLSAVQHINVPQTSKMYLVFNGTTGSSNNINVRGYTGSTYTTGVTLVPGERALVAYSLSANDVIKVSSNFLTGLTGTFTSGGVVYANTTSTLTTSGALTQYGVLYGGGAGGAPLATAAGTNNQLLVATTSAAPSWINPSSVTVGAATTATTAGTCTGNAATATNPASGGSFITSSNIGSQSVSYASSAGSASTATTANALNTSNAYTGTTFTATTQFSGPGTGLTGTASSLTVGNVSGVVAASNGGSGTAGSLTGPLYANGASAYTVATGAQIASNIGSSYVQNANYATFAGSGPGGGTIVTSPATSVAGNDGGWQSFTPVLTGSVSTVTFTYSANAQQGRYLVIGNMVYVQIYIGWTAASATTDNLIINNLPISGSALPSGWGNNYNGFGLLQCSHAVAYGLQLFPLVSNGGNKLYFSAPNGTYPLQSSSTSSFNAPVTISSTGYVYGCFSYSTS